MIFYICGREFEDLLNTAWSTIVTPGAWLSFNEQMIKSTAVAMRGILRFNPLKPIKHGECGFETWVALYKWAWENMTERRGGLARV